MDSSMLFPEVLAVHFVKQNVVETLRVIPDENGLMFKGRVPSGALVGDPLVVHPREGETWWLTVQGTPEDLAQGRVNVRLSLARVRSEIEHLQEETEKALVAFAFREFPGCSVKSVRWPHPQRGVTVTVEGPPRELHYGSGGKLTSKWLDLVLGRIPHERDAKHPYVSSVRINGGPGTGDPNQFVLTANIT